MPHRAQAPRSERETVFNIHALTTDHVCVCGVCGVPFADRRRECNASRYLVNLKYNARRYPPNQASFAWMCFIFLFDNPQHNNRPDCRNNWQFNKRKIVYAVNIAGCRECSCEWARAREQTNAAFKIQTRSRCLCRRCVVRALALTYYATIHQPNNDSSHCQTRLSARLRSRE